LFRRLSELVNDTDLTELDELILPKNPGDEHITSAVEDGINPKVSASKAGSQSQKSSTRSEKLAKELSPTFLYLEGAGLST
jgi:hypothetical protein